MGKDGIVRMPLQGRATDDNVRCNGGNLTSWMITIEDVEITFSGSLTNRLQTHEIFDIKIRGTKCHETFTKSTNLETT